MNNDELNSTVDQVALDTEAIALVTAIHAIAVKTKFNTYLVMSTHTTANVTYDVAFTDAADVHTITSSNLDTTQSATLVDAEKGHLFATTLLSYSMFSVSRISQVLIIKSRASVGFSELGIEKSTTEQRECSGGIKRFL